MNDVGSPLVLPYPWQQAQAQRMQQMQAQHKLPHALMLVGQKGIGKAHFARYLSHYLLCLSPQNGAPCDHCRGCELNRAETHPDIHWVMPEEQGRAIKVDQIRDLADFVTKTSHAGGFKLCVIKPAEAMNINAANALLKSLEEPAGDTVLILVSHAPGSVMATIRSRCQQLVFALPNQEYTLPWLTQLVGSEDPQMLLNFAGGAPLAALALLQGGGLEQRKIMLEDLLRVADGAESALGAASRWTSFDPVVVVEWMLIWLQLGVKMLVCGSQEGQNQPSTLMHIFQKLRPPYVFRYIDKLMQMKRQLLSGANPNKQLLLEELLLDWSALTRVGKVGGQFQRNALS